MSEDFLMNILLLQPHSENRLVHLPLWRRLKKISPKFSNVRPKFLTEPSTESTFLLYRTFC